MVKYLIGLLGVLVFCAVASAVYTSYSEKVEQKAGRRAGGWLERLLSIAVLVFLFAALVWRWALLPAAACLLISMIRRAPTIGVAPAIVLSLCQPFALVTYSFHKEGQASAALGAGLGGPMGPLPSQLGEKAERERGDEDNTR